MLLPFSSEMAHGMSAALNTDSLDLQVVTVPRTGLMYLSLLILSGYARGSTSPKTNLSLGYLEHY